MTDSRNSGFVSPLDWYHFCKYIETQSRYVLDDRWKEFIQAILDTGKKRQEVIGKDSSFVRARIGIEERVETTKGEWRFIKEPLKDLWPPPSKSCSEGRLNPHGIPHFYVADSCATAIAEVRPWVGANLSIGYFRLLKPKKLIDLTNDQISMGNYITEGGSVDAEKMIWSAMNTGFSTPVSPHEKTSFYAPMQYLADVFKVNGYDGMKYKSSLHEEGYNICFFSKNDFILEKIEIHAVDKVSYGCSPSGDPWIYDPKTKRFNGYGYLMFVSESIMKRK